jgi:hypothetical protein
MEGDWVERMFPGAGLNFPSEEERVRADEVAGYEIPRRRVVGDGTTPTNRAYVRAALHRWWGRSRC